MKKNWKKLIALGLGVMMLAGCGASNQSGAAETTTETAQESSGSTTDFPTKQINMIVQANPGGLSDQVSKGDWRSDGTGARTDGCVSV